MSRAVAPDTYTGQGLVETASLALACHNAWEVLGEEERLGRLAIRLKARGLALAAPTDSWNLSHLGYLYPGTTPVMIKLDHNRSCPWV